MQPGNTNLSSQFSQQLDASGVRIRLINDEADSSLVLFSLPAEWLLYKNIGDRFSATLRVEFAVFSSFSAKQASDTGSCVFFIDSKPASATYRQSFRIATPKGENSVLRVSFEDVLRNTTLVRFLNLNVRNRNAGPAYFITDSIGVPFIGDQLTLGQKYSILPVDSNDHAPRTVRCYFRDFPLATLPFRVIDDAVFDMRSDSSFVLQKEQWNLYSFNKPGIYFLQTDTLARQGLTLKVFSEDYPMVTTAAEMIEATRYLTTRKEYMALLNSDRKKQDIDGFWLDLGGSQERARTLIRSYYNRVQEANRLFTSYMEGWKTDRGMIHIIFGKPNAVYRDDETEQWTYNNMNGFPDQLFVFRKMNNPFTDNDYALIRQPVYENYWYMAVDQWRQGRPFNEIR